jgi:hypothetical protein
MKRTHHLLLVLDGLINILLGVLLLLFPLGLAPVLGVPAFPGHFYATLLGAVLFGIGIALLVEAYGAPHGLRGLGLAGAVTINFCGAGALILLLTTAPLKLPLRGTVLLWAIAVVVVVVGVVEVISQFRRRWS